MKSSKPTCASHRKRASVPALLHLNGLKQTPVRVAVLELLLKSHGPFSIEDIHQSIGGRGCNLTTIYRTLSSFEARALVRRTDLGDGVARFEFHCSEHPHHHLVCEKCRKISVLEHGFTSGLLRKARSLGFESLFPSQELRGLCRACARGQF